jgi:hypothetical protein
MWGSIYNKTALLKNTSLYSAERNFECPNEVFPVIVLSTIFHFTLLFTSIKFMNISGWYKKRVTRF